MKTTEKARPGWKVKAKDRIPLVAIIAFSVVSLCFYMGSTVMATNTRTPVLLAQDLSQDLLQGLARDSSEDSPQDPAESPLEVGLTLGGSISLSSRSGGLKGIDFGDVRPSLSPYVVPMAYQITCTSRENPVQVTIRGEDLKPVRRTSDPENPLDEPKTIPCSRISWRMSGEPSWSQLTCDFASLVLVPIGERRNICLDFKYDVLWEDPVGEYSAPVTVSFLPRAEVVFSKAAPNPFSPNGDGIKDETVITCDLEWDGKEPETIQCILGLPGDGDDAGWETVRKFEVSGVHPPTTVQVTWDGKDESGCQVPDACYLYSFRKAGQSTGFGSGVVVVDTIPPDLTVFSPKDSEEVTSSTTVSGQTESEECLISLFIQGRLASQARPSPDGSFSLGVAAPPGISTFSVVSEDLAGNRASHRMDVVNNTAVTISGPSYRETRSPVVEFQGLAPVSAVVALVVNGNEATRVKSTEQGEWATSGVRLEPGDNTVTASATNQRGEIITSKAPVTVRYVASTGSGKITGKVTDAHTGEPVKGAEIALVAEEIGIIATIRTDEDGTYESSRIPPGTYTLQASCLNYCTFESDGIQIASGEEIIFDFALVPNKALGLEKSVNVDACNIGDIVRYTIMVENLTDIEVNNVKVYDLLPRGITVIAGTSQVRGKKETEPEVFLSGQVYELAVWTLGALGPRKTATVSFVAAVGFCDRVGRATNKAYATGETKSGAVKTPASEATLVVSKGVFRDDGLIYGKVFFDTDGDGKMSAREYGVPGARITTENGFEISTDPSGMYTIRRIRPGFHMLVLSSDSLPQGFRCEERKVFVYVGPYSIVRLDFPVALCDPALRDFSGNTGDNCNTGDGYLNALRDQNAQGAQMESCGNEPTVMVAVGEATLSLAESSGNSRIDHKAEAGNEYTDPVISGNLAFFMSTKIGERHELTCGLDLARLGREDPMHSDPKHLDFEASILDYGDTSKVVRSLPYAGPLYMSLRGDAWEASYGVFRTDFAKSELAPYKRVLPGAIVRYEKGNITAACFDSTPFAETSRIQGGAFEAEVSPKLTLGGGVVRYRESQGGTYVYNIHGEYLGGEGLSAYCELAGSSRGHAGGGLYSPAGAGAISLRLRKEAGPVSLEARYRVVGPHFFSFAGPDEKDASRAELNSMEADSLGLNCGAFRPEETNPIYQVKTDTSDFSLRATLSPVTSLLPRLSLSGAVQVVRMNMSQGGEGLPSRKTAYELGAAYALGSSGIVVVDAKHATTRAEGKPDTITTSGLMMTDTSLGIEVKGRMPKAVSGSLGIRCGQRTNFRGSLSQVGYNQLKAGAKAAITSDLSVLLNLETLFECEDAVPIVPASRLSTKLGMGVDWTVSPYLRSAAKVILSSGDSTVFALRMAYTPSSRLEASLKCEAAPKTGKSKVTFKADTNPIPGLRLTVGYDREASRDNRTCTGYELGFTWRPVFPDSFMAFGGIKGKETAAGTKSELYRVLTGQVGVALVIDPVTDVSARYVWKLVCQGGNTAGLDAHVGTGLATFRITRRLDMRMCDSGSLHQSANNDIILDQRKDGAENEISGECGIGSEHELGSKSKTCGEYAISIGHKIDVAFECTLYLVDVERQRKTESAIEVGISLSENVRLALGYKWTRFRHGIMSQGVMSEAAHFRNRVYVRLGLGWATGI